MLRLIFLIVVGVLALSFFGISLQSIINSPAGQQNFGYLWHLVLIFWNWILDLLHWVLGFIASIKA
ncbi:MAG TPA: hypothetical protein VM103_02360 [Candidatus Paceibacterota bacterium]|nr:hypothetical protein [Candidatus Paceibacterota bacterium]